MLMLKAISKPHHVVATIVRARRASDILHHPNAKRLFTTGNPISAPSRTLPRNIEVFIPSTTQTRSPSATKLVTSHHDLPTYLTFHAARLAAELSATKRAKLSKTTVFLGTRYEYLIQRHLTDRLGFCLTRIGGKGDGGVDLVGGWNLSTASTTDLTGFSGARISRKDVVGTVAKSEDDDAEAVDGNENDGRDSEGKPTFRVLLQAKRLAKHRKPMPSLMRELEGTVTTAMTADARSIGAAFAVHRARMQSQTQSNGKSLATGDSDEAPTEGQSLDSRGTALSETKSGNEGNDEGDQQSPILGILVTTCPLTDGIETTMSHSNRPLMYICMEEHSSTKAHSRPQTQSRPEAQFGTVPEADSGTSLPSSIEYGSAPAISDMEGTATSAGEDVLASLSLSGGSNGSSKPNPTATDSASDAENQEAEEETAASAADAYDSSADFPPDVPRTVIRQIAWNQAAAFAGLQGFDVATKYSTTLGEDHNGLEGEASLVFHGQPVKFPRPAS